ncbi:hypothetical protein ABMA27_015089 [Loxostege sticticalis]|uniref:Uncharacterized protein n=1 Tax=Loxostege sticticalis TaxID=481309 RepID=A0ABR3I6C9_LOXSC
MLTKEFLYLISYLVISVDADDREFLLRLNSREVVDAFKTVLNSAYLRELADDFATKAADYLIKEIKNKGKEVTDIQMVKTREPTALEEHRSKYLDPPPILNEREAIALLQDPSPDGDNLDQEFVNLSDQENEDSKADVAVIGVTKINGRYFRRLLGII